MKILVQKTPILPSPLYGERVADAVGRASRLPEREARKPGEGFKQKKKTSEWLFCF